MMLMVWPMALRQQMETRIESGMETAMMIVLRQLPRKIRIMMPVRQAAMTASRTTPVMAARTKMDWSAMGSILIDGGSVFADPRQRVENAFDDARAWRRRRVFSTEISVPRSPLRRTMLVCGREAVGDRGDVANVDRRVVGRQLDGQIVQLRDGERAGVQIHIVFELADFGGAGGQNDVLIADGGDDVRGGQAFRLQQAGIQADVDLALFAAVGIGHFRARER